MPLTAWAALLWADWGTSWAAHLGITNPTEHPVTICTSCCTGGLARSSNLGVGGTPVGGLGNQLGCAPGHLLGGGPLLCRHPLHLRLPAGETQAVNFVDTQQAFWAMCVGHSSADEVRSHRPMPDYKLAAEKHIALPMLESNGLCS